MASCRPGAAASGIGHGARVASTVTSWARAACQRVTATPRPLLDVGCGEACYTGSLATTRPEQAEIRGMDVSHAAVEMASKRHKRPNFAVASARVLPVMDEALDLIVVMFGPQQPAEFRKVLKRSGLALIAAPRGELVRAV